MTFTVTYRGADGALREERVEAANRAECFARMKAQGIAPLSVKEGAPKGTRRPTGRTGVSPIHGGGRDEVCPSHAGRSRKFTFYIKHFTFAIAAAAAIAVVWWWLGNGEAQPNNEPETPKKPSLAKEVKPAAAPKPIDDVPKWKRDQEAWKKRGFKKNPWGTPIPEDLEYKPHWLYTPEDYARIDPGYEKRHEAFKKRQAENPWKTTADSQLSVLLFSKPGMPNLLIPFDRHFEKHFLKSLETPIVIDKEKDSPELQEQKRQMIDVKIYLKEQLDAGKDIAAILNEEHDRQIKLRGLRENLEKALREMEKTAKSVEEVEDYIASANKMLEEQGGAGAGKIGLPLALTRFRLQRESEKGEVGKQ